MLTALIAIVVLLLVGLSLVRRNRAALTSAVVTAVADTHSRIDNVVARVKAVEGSIEAAAVKANDAVRSAAVSVASKL